MEHPQKQEFQLEDERNPFPHVNDDFIESHREDRDQNPLP